MDQQEKLLKFQKAVFAEIEQKTAMIRIRRGTKQNLRCWNKPKKRCLPKRKTSCNEKTAENPSEKAVAKQQNAVWS